jgi:tetratricopeptide (TPR) repeat protein
MIGRIRLLRDDGMAERRFQDAIQLARANGLNISEPYAYLDAFYYGRGYDDDAGKVFSSVVEIGRQGLDKALEASSVYEYCRLFGRARQFIKTVLPDMSAQDAAVLEARLAMLYLFDERGRDIDAAAKHAANVVNSDPRNGEALCLLGIAEFLAADQIEDAPRRLEKMNAAIDRIEKALVENESRVVSKSAVWACLAKAQARAFELETDSARKAEHRERAIVASVRSLSIEPVYGLAKEMKILYDNLTRP